MKLNYSRVKAEHPFSDFWLYKVWHKNEGRWQANLISVIDPDTRTTVSYARYTMSVHLGRLLTKQEHVDHKNEDKSNDSIENLQILTPAENKEKSEAYRRILSPKYTELTCAFCGSIFDYPSNNFRFRSKQGRVDFYCSKSCAMSKRFSKVKDIHK